jgi:cystathionine beta-lyase/cystathionine gamma-synthase
LKRVHIIFILLINKSSHGLTESENESTQVRLSIGLEDPNDLLADIQQALSKLREK